MCLTIPGKILSINDGLAVVENGSRKATVDLSFVLDAKPGDWILYATDRAVKRISEVDAKEIISLLEEHYHPVDIAKLPLKFKQILFKVRSGKGQLTKDEIIYLLKLKGKDNLETLYAEANTLRKEKLEDFACIHGIIEFSNYCKNSCFYCGLRRENQEIKRYRMSQDEIVRSAQKAVKEGYKLIVLQSGEDEFYTDDLLLEIVGEILDKMKVFIFLSVGERSVDFYQKAYDLGATGVLIRFESANSKLYSYLRPGKKIDDRLRLIRKLEDIGYYVATGSMMGLPGQRVEDIADDLLMLRELGAPMISAGPYLPASGTPLAKLPIPKNNFELALKYIAIARFLMPEVKIPVTTALETLDRENGRHRGLLAGANALMFNLTPEKYCKNYNIYDNKFIDREKIWQKYGLFKGEESWEMLEDRLVIKKRG